MPQRSPGGHRAYAYADVAALRAALAGGVSIASAVTHARAKVATDSSSLVSALCAYDRDLADLAIETALAFRSVERSVEELLLPSLQEILGSRGIESAAWAFSARWAADWLRRAMCLASPSPRPTAVVLGDGSESELDIDALYIRALELLCTRAGLKVLRLPTRAVAGVGDAVSVHRPQLVVLAGGRADDDIAARWADLIRRSVGPIPVGLYRRAAVAGGNLLLPPAPGEAQKRLMELIDTSAPVRQLRHNDRLSRRAAMRLGSQREAPSAVESAA